MINHREINKYMEQYPDEKVVEVAMQLWVKMSVEIVTIIGLDGFNALYQRSVILAEAKSPWQESDTKEMQSYDIITLLKHADGTQTPTQIRSINCLLLTTFSDILSSLIGDQLTSRILEVAWEGTVINQVRG
ncbi:conserved protein of unknown function [Acidithiobacillus ferrivorans]|uniref:Uncharacterized protein n=2 Tax=Acidithiobacillus ferrivorans TaxID=160808 RepID=A0ABY1MKG2_9PROT|nr:hypothetical protein [Acidithiobacillus ferrivorans]SMH64231.1 conserved protein of unknown function [Acidithiobacillus ferrivorans]